MIHQNITRAISKAREKSTIKGPKLKPNTKIRSSRDFKKEMAGKVRRGRTNKNKWLNC